jgi:hypothetical protein
MRRGIAAAMAGRLQDLALVGSRLRVRYILYPAQVVPQPIGRVKRLSTGALNCHPRGRHGTEEQAIAASQAAARIGSRCSGGPPGRDATLGAGPGDAGQRSEPVGRRAGARPPGPATAPAESRAPVCRAASGRGRRHPPGSSPVLPIGPAPDCRDRRFDVRAPDGRLDRPARFAPGVSLGRQARKPAA